jgi:hypothetical protein
VRVPSELLAGGCHCGRIRFQLVVREWTALRCCCSICRMKGFVHVIVPDGDFTALSGDEVRREYTFNTHTAKHWFCGVCGVASYYKPRSHPEGISVNLACLDGDAGERFAVVDFDGTNWEANVALIR